MISGVATQGPFSFLPRNVVTGPLDVFNDDDVINSVVVLSGLDRILRPGSVSDPDVVFAGAASRFWFLAPTCVIVSDSVFSARVAARNQVLLPLLHLSLDAFKLPTVRIPGILQHSALHADDGAIFAPSVLIHGSLRPALHSALDTFYAPVVVGARTLLPNSVYNAADSIFAPVARVTVLPSRVIDNDTVFAPTRT